MPRKSRRGRDLHPSRTYCSEVLSLTRDERWCCRKCDIGNGVVYLAPKEVAEIVFANAYDQWGEVEYRKVMDMITSIFGN